MGGNIKTVSNFVRLLDFVNLEKKFSPLFDLSKDELYKNSFWTISSMKMVTIFNFTRVCRLQYKSWNVKACLRLVLNLQKQNNKLQTVNVKQWTVNGRYGPRGQQHVE